MTALRYHAVVVEDDPQIRRFLRTVLPDEGFEVFEAETGERGLVEAATRKPDVVILDLGLPDLDGAEVIRRLREWSQVPILVLSARTREQDKIAALDAGADDYLAKPFGVGELMARLRVALRHGAARAGGAAEPAFAVGELQVDLAARRVSIAGREVKLTPIEWRLLAALVKHAGHGGDAPAAAARRLGAGVRRAVAHAARAHGVAPAQGRGRPGAAAVPPHRDRRRLPARRRLSINAPPP